MAHFKQDWVMSEADATRPVLLAELLLVFMPAPRSKAKSQ